MYKKKRKEQQIHTHHFDIQSDPITLSSIYNHPIRFNFRQILLILNNDIFTRYLRKIDSKEDKNIQEILFIKLFLL